MDRYVFYDPRTGEIVHTHQSLRVGSQELEQPDDETLALLAERIVTGRSVERVATAAPLVSSLRAARRVDVASGRVETLEADPRFRVRTATVVPDDPSDDENGA